MKILATNGVRITVENLYQSRYSKPTMGQYIFTYRITIENTNNFTVQLIRRHWNIKNAVGESKVVSGEGVIGKQPILKPGEKHQYVSWCPLSTPIGQMDGHYEMKAIPSGETLLVDIPTFHLVALNILN